MESLLPNLFSIIVSGAVAIQGILLSSVLLFRGNSYNIPTRILSGLVLAISFLAITITLDISGALKTMPWLIYLHYPFTILIGPLFYLYSRSLLVPKYMFRKYEWLHLLPLLIAFLIKLPIYLATGPEKIEHMYDNRFLLERETHLAIFLCVLFLYLGLTFKTISEHTKFLHANLTEFDRYRINWLKVIGLWLGILLTVGFGFLLTDNSVFYEYFAPVSLFILIYSLVFKGYRQHSIFEELHGLEADFIKQANYARSLGHPEGISYSISIEDGNSSKEKYAKSGLDSARLARLSVRVMDIMKSDKLFLQPQLRANDLAKKMNINTNQLSQVINIGLKKTFYDLVNEFRVEEAQRRLSDPKNVNLTILSIAEDVGFSSKSTFNSFFKAHTNETPSAFRNRALSTDK